MENDIPAHLWQHWQDYLDICASLGIEPNQRRFLRYNEIYPDDDYPAPTNTTV
jgi:hypothetical protein